MLAVEGLTACTSSHAQAIVEERCACGLLRMRSTRKQTPLILNADGNRLSSQLERHGNGTQVAHGCQDSWSTRRDRDHDMPRPSRFRTRIATLALSDSANMRQIFRYWMCLCEVVQLDRKLQWTAQLKKRICSQQPRMAYPQRGS
jgi:hypothetical protein